ncbi:1-deoxy-D-xylulose-5-phosphate synthase [Trinickia sp. LjRoot230]|uniref:1-deoxy-D-xylulose-5-phosphate synthase n=1 Tax=Trinickia sp. LjRoot230 TaxID=3342288 RepID=UPI003ECDB8C8
MYDLLKTIDDPYTLRQLDIRELPILAAELRAFLLETVSRTGGHLSSNLGSVELTIALHYVFETPHDRLVWDVGHQSYAHKILTGRREGMKALRQSGGLSGFPRRCESEYDTFGTAHSSTSISAALGMAIASRLKRERRASVAVIGDGAISAGEAFEALNNVGVHDDLPLIVILNDNEMSISPPVGALHRYLTKLMDGQFYASEERRARGIPSKRVREGAHNPEAHAKAIRSTATVFEEFGFYYAGPIDGHDLATLVPALERLKQQQRPQLIHVVTEKGHGYKLAEDDPVLYHGPGKFDPGEGIKSGAGAKATYTQVFGEWLCDAAMLDHRVVGITPAMREGSGLVEFERRFPDRYFDVGIAEQHALTFAGGLASEGLKPVVAIYSTFLQRAYDQLIHDIALQNLPVLFALDRAGLVGADGPTHAGAYDIAFLRCIPNMTIMAASDENECRQMLHTGLQIDGPCAVRYPRGSGPGATVERRLDMLPVGKGEIRRQTTSPKGRRIALLAFGSMVAPSLQAAEKLNATVVNMRFVKPIDTQLITETARTHDALVTVEEGVVMGGAGSAAAEVLAAQGLSVPLLQLGLPDAFVPHGDCAALLAQCGLDGDGIARAITDRFAALLIGTRSDTHELSAQAA